MNIMQKLCNKTLYILGFRSGMIYLVLGEDNLIFCCTDSWQEDCFGSVDWENDNNPHFNDQYI